MNNTALTPKELAVISKKQETVSKYQSVMLTAAIDAANDRDRVLFRDSFVRVVSKRAENLLKAIQKEEKELEQNGNSDSSKS